DDNVPVAQIVAVVPPRRVSRGHTEVGEIPGRVAVVIVIAQGGTGALSVPAPERAVAPGVILGRAAGIGVVASGEHGSGNVVQQRGGRGSVARATFTDVPGSDQHLRSPVGLDHGGQAVLGGGRVAAGADDDPVV